MQENTQYIAGLYCRLSKDDEQHGESVSIGTQRSILEDYCNSHGHAIFKFYIDDGYSGLNFNRPGFQEMLQDIDRGLITMVITKDLSRLGRDYIMTGYYSEIFFPSKDVRYLALADDFDSLKGGNEFAPFKNILNDMYAAHPFLRKDKTGRAVCSAGFLYFRKKAVKKQKTALTNAMRWCRMEVHTVGVCVFLPILSSTNILAQNMAAVKIENTSI